MATTEISHSHSGNGLGWFRRGRSALLALTAAAAVVAGLASCATGTGLKLLDFKEINLVSSVDGVAPLLDAGLTDAWGLEFGDPGRVWVNNNKSGLSIVYDGSGNQISVKNSAGEMVPLRVQVPPDPTVLPVGGPDPLSGLYFNAIHGQPGAPFDGDGFVFVSEQGVISGWQPLPGGKEPLTATTRIDNNAAGAVFKGVTAMKGSAGWRLYVADFGEGTVDEFDATYQPVTNRDGFRDAEVPPGYAPFNIKAIGDRLFVTFAKQSIDKQNDVHGLGNGYVDVFDGDGKLLKRLVSGGRLDSPWGLTLAPRDYGSLSGMLLVGNFGDGFINVYDPSSGAYVGTVAEGGAPLQIDGLWALTFGTDNGAGASNQLFFTSGPSAESQGIFGKLLYLGVNVAAENTLTIYSGQHEQTMNALVDGFDKATGISTSVRADDEGVLANLIVQEASRSPADVFVTENSPALAFLSERKSLAPVAADTLALVPKEYSSPNGDWVGVSARVSALVYNTDQVRPADLPSSILDLAQPQWKGKVAFAPTETDFQPLVTAIAKLQGTAAASSWLKGLKTNSQIYPDNESVVAAVNNGQSAVGLINHYYWYRLRDETGGAAKMHSALHYYQAGDPGNLIDVSGAAVLASSRHLQSAQRFLAFIVGVKGQTILAGSESYEYPLGSGISTAKDLPTFSSLQPPKVGLSDLGDGSGALDLMRAAGLL